MLFFSDNVKALQGENQVVDEKFLGYPEGILEKNYEKGSKD
jgi:hypothetical protein